MLNLQENSPVKENTFEMASKSASLALWTNSKTEEHKDSAQNY